MNKEGIPMFTFNTKTKEFSVLGHKFEGVNSIKDFINYIHNLDKENKQLQQENNQLKANRDEAIEYMNTLCDEYADNNYDIKCEVLETIYQKLKRGKGGSNE